LEQPRNGALARAHGAVQQDDATLWPVPFGRGLEHVHEPHERDVETEDAVLALVYLVPEEVVADELLLVVYVLFSAVRDDHVVHALKGVTRDLRPVSNDGEVLFERALPREVAVAV